MGPIVMFWPMLLASALCSCAWIEAKQRELVLRPTPGRAAEFAEDSESLQRHFRPGDLRWSVAVAGAQGRDDRLALWWLPQPDAKAPALLYLHGTLRNLYQNLPKIDALRQAGFAILAVDYRGWGDSTALVPSEATIDADAAVAWAELQRRQPEAGRRVIYGHSLGGAVAVTLASRLHRGSDYAALVLESTFTRLPDVAAAAGFWGRLGASVTTLQFDTLSRIGRIDAPLLILHGDADATVPVALGRRLRDAAPAGVTWVEIPGGSHSGLHEDAPVRYQQLFKDLLQGLAPAPAGP
jgi:pimeloyl-ACP methyl ester carboxylesterase